MPKQVTKTYTLFGIDELSEKAKAKAIDNLRTTMTADSYYSELVTEDITEKIQGLGLPTTDIRWRHSSSQGDGLAIYGEINFDEQKLVPVTAELKRIFEKEELDMVIAKAGPHMYDHSKTMRVEIGNVSDDAEHKAALAFAETLQDALEEKTTTLFRELVKSYDWYFEDAQLVDEARANEYVFLDNGSLANHLSDG